MDKIILKLRFVHKILTTDQRIDSDSLGSEFNGLDDDFYRNGDAVRNIERRCFIDITWWHLKIRDEEDAAALLMLTEEQIKTLLDMMTFFLDIVKPYVYEENEDDEEDEDDKDEEDEEDEEDEDVEDDGEHEEDEYKDEDEDSDRMQQIRTEYIIDALLRLTEVLLEGNKKAECEAWVKEQMSKLKSLIVPRTEDSILHRAMPIDDRFNGGWRAEPIVRLLVENGKMDVNVENRKKQTPFHILSQRTSHIPTDDQVNVAELLIDNGAHMDSLDNNGIEASGEFSFHFPKWSFNFNLKCLAATAIIDHGVQYENIAPKTQFAFIESHNYKRPRLSQKRKKIQIASIKSHKQPRLE